MITSIVLCIICIFIISSIFASITLYFVNNVKVSRMNGTGIAGLNLKITKPRNTITQEPILDQVIYNISNDITWSNYGLNSGALKGNQKGLTFTQQLPDLPPGLELAWNGFYKIGCNINGTTQYTNPVGPVCSDDTTCKSGGQGPKIRISAYDNDMNYCAKQGGVLSVLRQRPLNGDYTNFNVSDDSKFVDITNNLQNSNVNGPYNGTDTVFTDTYQIDSNVLYTLKSVATKMNSQLSVT